MWRNALTVKTSFFFFQRTSERKKTDVIFFNIHLNTHTPTIDVINLIISSVFFLYICFRLHFYPKKRPKKWIFFSRFVFPVFFFSLSVSVFDVAFEYFASFSTAFHITMSFQKNKTIYARSQWILECICALNYHHIESVPWSVMVSAATVPFLRFFLCW